MAKQYVIHGQPMPFIVNETGSRQVSLFGVFLNMLGLGGDGWLFIRRRHRRR